MPTARGLRPVALRPRPLAEVAERLGVAPAGPAGPGGHITGITHDSRAVRPGDLYAALPGANVHGARFAAAAAAAGAVAVLTDPAGAELARRSGLPTYAVADPRRILGPLAAWVYGHPTQALTLVGVTGTNGKTTTAYLIEAGLRHAGRVTGLVGTVETRVGDDRLPSGRTTPEATELHALLAVMRERSVEDVVLEVSSHALALGRVDGIVFDLAVFTNLSQDHLDFHVDMESYFQVKASLFTAQRARRGIVDVDGAWGRRLAASAGIPVVTVSATGSAGADWRGRAVGLEPSGASRLLATGPRGVEVDLVIDLPGDFNLANALLATAALHSVGVPAGDIEKGLAGVGAVPGRMEQVRRGQDFVAVVDYAHTPDAVARAVAALRPSTTGRVLVVLGCGGERDETKRPLMGEVAARAADVLLVTDDNPRGEDPARIRAAVLGGAARVPAPERAEVVEIADRQEAVTTAVGRASSGDVVIVLGKGHEQGQEVAGVVHPFDDRAVLAAALAGLAEPEAAG